MKLVFIHGWGFDASFWDALAPQLAAWEQTRIDRGFFGAPSGEIPDGDDCILIGHSLGFLHGMTQKKNWAGWVAINGFARFVPDCVPAAELRTLRLGFSASPSMALKGFYNYAGLTPPTGAHPDKGRLLAGLDELRDGAIESFAARGLVLASRKDVLVPVAASEALTQKTSAKLLWHDMAGHGLPQTDPVWCAEAIRGFLAQIINK